MYTPDLWLVIKINGTDPHYRLFGSWYGGYMGSDEWRMNSGIKSVTEDENFYYVHGASGSTYNCHKKSKGISGYGSSVLNALIKNQPELDIQIIPEDVIITELEFT